LSCLLCLLSVLKFTILDRFLLEERRARERNRMRGMDGVIKRVLSRKRKGEYKRASMDIIPVKPRFKGSEKDLINVGV